MSDSINKANKRQAGNGRKKNHYAGNFATGIKNKIRKLATRMRQHPDDAVAAERHEWWKKNGYTRKGTKRVK
jgi:hypothetical protein